MNSSKHVLTNVEEINEILVRDLATDFKPMWSIAKKSRKQRMEYKLKLKTNKKLKKIVIKGMEDLLKKNELSESAEVAKAFELTSKDTKALRPLIYKVVDKNLDYIYTEKYGIQDTLNSVKIFDLDKEVISTVIKRVEILLNKDELSNASLIAKKFRLDLSSLKPMAIKRLQKLVSEGKLDEAIQISEMFHLKEREMYRYRIKVVGHVKQIILKTDITGVVDGAKFLTAFHIKQKDTEQFKLKALEVLRDLLKEGWIDSAIKVIIAYRITDRELKKII